MTTAILHLQISVGDSSGAVVRAVCCKPPGGGFKFRSYLCLWDVFPWGVIPWSYVPGVARAESTEIN